MQGLLAFRSFGFCIQLNFLYKTIRKPTTPHYIHKSTPLGAIQDGMKPLFTFPRYCSKTHSNVFVTSKNNTSKQPLNFKSRQHVAVFSHYLICAIVTSVHVPN